MLETYAEGGWTSKPLMHLCEHHEQRARKQLGGLLIEKDKIVHFSKDGQ